jgi:L-threonylcarbamoyladenylate synthase
LNNWHLNQATRIIFRGGVIAYPTEAVYGLGCLPYDYFAVSRILDLKNRPVQKGLILVAANINQLAGYIEFPDETVRQRVLATWPGPVTWVLPAKPEVPIWLRGQHNTIAVRVSKHDVIRSLCEKTGALVSTSANPANRPPARTALKVRDYFGKSLDYILHASIGSNRLPTQIIEANTGKILRSGG